eukprot:gene12180-8381_t
MVRDKESECANSWCTAESEIRIKQKKAERVEGVPPEPSMYGVLVVNSFTRDPDPGRSFCLLVAIFIVSRFTDTINKSTTQF